MILFASLAFEITFWAVYGGGFIAAVMYALRKSEDPARMAFRLAVTGLVMGPLIWYLRNSSRAHGVDSGNYDPGSAFVAVIITIFCGMILVVMWAQPLGALLSKPFDNMFTGGDREIDPQPFYSIAIARRKQGQYLESVAEIRKQLALFPHDYAGTMMLAEIQVEHLNDLEGARLSVEQLFLEAGQNPMNLAAALNRLADWELRYGQDAEAACRALERIIELFPATEQGQIARQRIAHLSGSDPSRARSTPAPIALTQGAPNIGLRQESASLRPVEESPDVTAAKYVKQLEAHPHDNETREKLALLYADYYRRPDLAIEQLEQLIAQPNQLPKHTIHWLNQIADVHVKSAGDLVSARQTLERVIALAPRGAAGENAKQRIAFLPTEMRNRRTNEDVKLGNYDKNIGLGS